MVQTVLELHQTRMFGRWFIVTELGNLLEVVCSAVRIMRLNRFRVDSSKQLHWRKDFTQFFTYIVLFPPMIC